MAYARKDRRERRWTIAAPEKPRLHARGRTLVLADIGIVLLSSVAYSILMVVATGPDALLERVPAFLMVMLVSCPESSCQFWENGVVFLHGKTSQATEGVE